MSVQNLRTAPAPEQSHDREQHPASGCSRDDRGAGWQWQKRRRRDIFATAGTFGAASSSSAQQLLEREFMLIGPAEDTHGPERVPMSAIGVERTCRTGG